MKNKYSLFPGCIAKNMYPSIEKSTRIVFEKIGIELLDHKYSCCPAPGVFRGYDRNTHMTLGVRNIVMASQDDVDVMTICNGCYGSLWEANHMFRKSKENQAFVNEMLGKIGLSYDGNTEVYHFADILFENLDKVIAAKEFDLGLRVAIHYGCHYLRPSEKHPELNPENPRIVEAIVEAIGCEPVDFKQRLSCCGAGGGVWSGAEDVSLKILDEKLKNIEEVGVDCIVNICPFCHLQLDQGQGKLKKYKIPVLHLSELIGLAFGVRPKHLAMHTHMISTRDVEKKVKKAMKDEE
ncbi:MAG: CoB--CoM heterodisulfide reductase subunit B [Candidatus Methanofastidiosa archaeon]|nr:CoB--CoM heterodisulfide reductase subunit B [Candidatus Methanofastidiosa archaeon]